MRPRVAALCLGVVLLGAAVPAARAADDPAVLAPGDGFRARQGFAWLVVRSDAVPRVVLDGKPLRPTIAPEDGVHHLRIGPLRPQGSRLEVASAQRRVTLTVFGDAGPGAAGFHPAAPKACWSCHETGPKGCGECHPWTGARHSPMRSGECTRCHDLQRPLPPERAQLCRPCHPNQAAGRHTGLRHPVSAPQDPARPGRRFDCTSCHDPHAPSLRGRLAVEQRQQWCRRCHRR
ncbi:MAG: hypothetical protein HZB55_06510 [Deltaproteobacteria bacterium]|nr:hypothetical protein [Deltaproteobacteria bacterium]